ncbi:hypothetical protein BCV70DRAFT_197066 [Testicularia cyperi]|uniref:Uncharacterized protein n=1 Tax=Testicularia cyperi TaxID=1882483 RepID=A0A317XX21_9BASI|nr:hypothetical protein BCV70DRAFT_197066 [Testicularia cyperi]
MYSTSPSGSSMASSSGRSSPEQQPPSHAQASSPPRPQRSNSFLLPQFLFAPASASNASTSAASADASSPAAIAHSPRRTSFASALGTNGRLSALSAFGFLSSGSGASPSSLSTSPPSYPARFPMAPPKLGSTGSSELDTPLSSTSSSLPPSQEQKPAPPQKRHVCFPDGMGGTMCLEIKDRNRRGSSLN